MFLGEQSGTSENCLVREVDSDQCYSWKDVLDNPIHVRLFRQYVPGDNRHRFSLKSVYIPRNDGVALIGEDHVPRG